MTYQSPRIYIYKITFEEVPYYYYGVHKEKYFNEEYWGSPITNKWCWELYTAKKKILQLFDFTDEGWLKAQEIEERLIKPFFNTDKWCLNESCGGKVSLKVLRESGNKCYELGLGFHSLTKEQRSENGKRNGKISGKKGGKKVYELGIGVHGRTKEQMSEDGKQGGKKSYELKIGIHGITKEQMVENGRKCGNRTYELGIAIHGQSKEKMRKRETHPMSGKTHSEETKEKMCKSHLGKPGICGFKGKNHTEEAKQKLREGREVKYFSVISPTGEVIHSKNAKQFCRDNNLDKGHFSQVLNGKRPVHKGFRLYTG